MNLLALATRENSSKSPGGSSTDVYVMKSPYISGLRQKVAAVLQRKAGNFRETLKNEVQPI
jgi:hypothetical protein